jgi:hypothetical protein
VVTTLHPDQALVSAASMSRSTNFWTFEVVTAI